MRAGPAHFDPHWQTPCDLQRDLREHAHVLGPLDYELRAPRHHREHDLRLGHREMNADAHVRTAAERNVREVAIAVGLLAGEALGIEALWIGPAFGQAMRDERADAEHVALADAVPAQDLVTLGDASVDPAWWVQAHGLADHHRAVFELRNVLHRRQPVPDHAVRLVA